MVTECPQINLEPSLGKISFTIVRRSTDQGNTITNKSLPFIDSHYILLKKRKSTTSCEYINCPDEV